MINYPLYFVAVVFLLVIDGVALAARSAFLQTSYVRLIALRDPVGDAVDRTMALMQQPTRVKASLNFTLVVARFLLAGSLYWGIMSTQLGLNIWVMLLIMLLGALLLFIIEWFIERMISRQPEVWVVRMTPFVRALKVILALPLALVLSLSGDYARPEEFTSGVTEDELITMVDAGQEEGVVEEGERRMIHSIFRLGGTLAREIMVPRIDMLALDVDTSFQAAVDALLSSGHSRVPVYEETVDNTLGLLYIKDLLREWRDGKQDVSLRNLLRPTYFIPEAKKVDQLLEEMQSQRIHIAIVVDEYGGVAGLVTLEDIVEEILGEIQDEYDQGEESPFQILADGEYQFAGRIDLDDFNEIMGSDLPSDEADTLGGYIYSRLGRVPNVGEKVQKDRLVLTVEQVIARRIRKVRASWVEIDIQDNDEKEHAHG